MASPEASQSVERTLNAEIKIYYDLHAADRPSAPLLVALHGYGANKKQMMREAQQMAPTALQLFHYRVFIST